MLWAGKSKLNLHWSHWWPACKRIACKCLCLQWTKIVMGKIRTREECGDFCGNTMMSFPGSRWQRCLSSERWRLKEYGGSKGVLNRVFLVLVHFVNGDYRKGKESFTHQRCCPRENAWTGLALKGSPLYSIRQSFWQRNLSREGNQRRKNPLITNWERMVLSANDTLLVWISSKMQGLSLMIPFTCQQPLYLGHEQLEPPAKCVYDGNLWHKLLGAH